MKIVPLILLWTVSGHAQDGTRHAARTPEQIRSAAQRAVSILQRSATGFYKSQNCFSCHGDVLPMMAFQMARERGVPVDETAARQVAAKGLLGLPDRTSLDIAVQNFLMLDPPTDDGWALIAMHAAGVDPNVVTGIYAQHLVPRYNGRMGTGPAARTGRRNRTACLRRRLWPYVQCNCTCRAKVAPRPRRALHAPGNGCSQCSPWKPTTTPFGYSACSEAHLRPNGPAPPANSSRYKEATADGRMVKILDLYEI